MDEKERQKKYRENNREVLRQKAREYYQKNKNQINKRRRSYYQEHKDQILEQHKEYRSKNKERYKKSRAKSYQKNKERINKINREWRKQNRKKWFLIIKEYYGELKCSRCGYDECFASIEFHHREKKEKKDILARLMNCKPTEERVRELEKCDLLCSNCHRRLHYLEKKNDGN